MPSTYTLELSATGDGGEALSTTAMVDADSPTHARAWYHDQTVHVDYWEIEIERVTATSHE